MVSARPGRSAGSGTPAAANPATRSWQLSQWPQGVPSGGGIVAAEREAVVEAQRQPQPDDVGLRQRHQRRVHRQRAAFDAGARGHPGQLLEGMDELRPAIGIAGVVERVDADEDVGRAQHFGPAQGHRQEDGVARGNVGGGNVGRVHVAILGDGHVARRQRRAADRGEVEIEHEVPRRRRPIGRHGSRPRSPDGDAGRSGS